MTTHSVSLDITSALGRPRVCTACGSTRLSVTPADDGVTFTCLNCSGSWRLELGVLVPVEPDRPREPGRAHPGPRSRGRTP